VADLIVRVHPIDDLMPSFNGPVLATSSRGIESATTSWVVVVLQPTCRPIYAVHIVRTADDGSACNALLIETPNGCLRAIHLWVQVGEDTNIL